MATMEARGSIREAFDRALARVVLGAVDEAREALGRAPTRTEVARLLVGPKRTQARAGAGGDMQGRVRSHLEDAGKSPAPRSFRRMLSRFGATDVGDALQHLADLGLLEPAGNRGARFALTHHGDEFVHGRSERTTGIVDRLLVRDDFADEAFRALAAMRASIASAENVSAYVVLTNRTMRAIGARRPLTPEDLNEIPGIGAGKAARYGKAILDVVRGLPPKQEPEERCGGSGKDGWDRLRLEPADFGLPPKKNGALAGAKNRIAEGSVAWRTEGGRRRRLARVSHS